ncbi:hypothetical protein [Halorubrum sp. AJ67]|nr:hypothetical protein [Halorubrum sp. AJ67]CDK38917.1 hypothetical protein BN903_211 [Halorubrum sp. AJ67]
MSAAQDYTIYSIKEPVHNTSEIRPSPAATTCPFSFASPTLSPSKTDADV